MNKNSSDSNYKNRSRAITFIGVMLLLCGIAIGLLGPLEMYCFYLFSDGGRFHYEGFGFGSFMFGNIASQIIGYYSIAAMFIPLGYGHLTKREWARTLSLTLLWSWMVIGAPMLTLVYFILLASKDLHLPVALTAAVFLGLSYLLLPVLLIRFYTGQNVKQTFKANDTFSRKLKELPMPVLVLSFLFLFYIIILHILILFNGIYPVFGKFVFGIKGILLLDLSITCMICLLTGLLRLRLWAWWGSVIWSGLFTFSTVLTFFSYDYSTILSGLSFPSREMEFLKGIPVQGYHFSILTGIPLLITWIITIRSRRYFRRHDQALTD